MQHTLRVDNAVTLRVDHRQVKNNFEWITVVIIMWFWSESCNIVPLICRKVQQWQQYMDSKLVQYKLVTLECARYRR